MQRTCPGMPPCDPAGWGACFGAPDAPVFRLSRCYRSAMPIARLCESLLPGEANLNPIGREGEPAVVAEYSDALLRRTLERFRKEGYRSIAVLTRTRAQAAELAGRLEDVLPPRRRRPDLRGRGQRGRLLSPRQGHGVRRGGRRLAGLRGHRRRAPPPLHRLLPRAARRRAVQGLSIRAALTRRFDGRAMDFARFLTDSIDAVCPDVLYE